MYKRILIAIDNSERSQHALEQGLALTASEEGEVVLTSVIPAYQGDLRLMGDSSILESMRQPYIEALERAAEKAAERGIKCKKVLVSGEPGEEILNTADDERPDLVIIGKKASRLSDLIPIGSVSAKILKLSDVDVLVIPQGRQLKMERIMVAFDGSKHAEMAAEKAGRISVRYGASCLLTTIYEMSLEGYALSPDIAMKLYDKAKKRQEPIISMLKERGVRNCEQIIEHGDPIYRALSELVQRQGVGLAVLGSRGAGNLAKILLGSVAARFISSGVCPTLVVK